MNSENNVIYALTPRDDLDANDYYDEYEKRLNEAFKNCGIYNIGVSGSYGIGKSSILHTYSKKSDKRFLYISLMDFSNNTGNIDHADSDKNQISGEKSKELEVTLIRQLLCFLLSDKYNIKKVEKA